MQIIIKPLGLIVILSAIVTLLTLVLFAPKTAPAINTAVHTEVPNVITRTSLPSVPAIVKSLPIGVLLEPDITSKEWGVLVASGKVETKVVNSTVAYHPYARQFTITQLGKYYSDIQIAHAINVALKKGKRIRLSFWARSQDSCPITVAVEQNNSPYAKVLFKQEQLSPDWQAFSEEWVQQSDTPENWAKMDFQVGHKLSTLELTGVTIREID